MLDLLRQGGFEKIRHWRRIAATAMTQMKSQSESAKKSGSVRAERADPNAVLKEKAKGSGGEIGGPKGLEPTRYGDWEKNGRCIDF
jgi:hypothetical protein